MDVPEYVALRLDPCVYFSQQVDTACSQAAINSVTLAERRPVRDHNICVGRYLAPHFADIVASFPTERHVAVFRLDGRPPELDAVNDAALVLQVQTVSQTSFDLCCVLLCLVVELLSKVGVVVLEIESHIVVACNDDLVIEVLAGKPLVEVENLLSRPRLREVTRVYKHITIW